MVIIFMLKQDPMVLEWKKGRKEKGRDGQRNPGRFIVYNLRDLMEGPKKDNDRNICFVLWLL